MNDVLQVLQGLVPGAHAPVDVRASQAQREVVGLLRQNGVQVLQGLGKLPLLLVGFDPEDKQVGVWGVLVLQELGEVLDGFGIVAQMHVAFRAQAQNARFLRLMLEEMVEIAQRVLVAVQALEGDGPVQARLGVRGQQGRGLVQVGQGLFVAAHAHKQPPPLMVGPGVVGGLVQDVGIEGQGFLCLPRGFQGFGLVGQDPRGVGREGLGLVECVQGFVEVALVSQDHAAQGQGPAPMGEIGLGFVQVLQGLLQFAGLAQQFGPPGEGPGILFGVQGEGRGELVGRGQGFMGQQVQPAAQARDPIVLWMVFPGLGEAFPREIGLIHEVVGKSPLALGPGQVGRGLQGGLVGLERGFKLLLAPQKPGPQGMGGSDAVGFQPGGLEEVLQQGEGLGGFFLQGVGAQPGQAFRPWGQGLVLPQAGGVFQGPGQGAEPSGVEFQKQGDGIQGHAQEGVRVLEKMVGEDLHPGFPPKGVYPSLRALQFHGIGPASLVMGQVFPCGLGFGGQVFPGQLDEGLADFGMDGPPGRGGLEDGKVQEPAGEGVFFRGFAQDLVE